MTRQEYEKQWREKNKERVKQYSKEYYIKNKEKLDKESSIRSKIWYQDNKEKSDIRNKNWHKNNRKRSVEIVQKYVKNNKEKVNEYLKGYQQTSDGLFRTTKYGAGKKNNEFLLTKEQFKSIILLPCKYCGEKIERRGIDRMDNNKGYTMENSAPCCKMCNYMKKNYLVENFLQHIKKIHDFNC